MTFSNVYADPARAVAYATLEFPGTYYLAFRDLPAILAEHVGTGRALDFGCGAGRSTRFLKKHGFEAIGIDIASHMIDLARNADPAGTYHLVKPGDFTPLNGQSFDLILSAFAFDNIPDVANRRGLLRGLAALLSSGGRMMLLGSAPEIYVNEWTSFTTRDFPQNRLARSGEVVKIVMKDVADQRAVEDVLWFHDDYADLFAQSGLELIGHYKPLGREGEPFRWISETSIAPWTIYVLRSAPDGANP